MSTPKTTIDCGDNSCHFSPNVSKGGQRTNGGCRCFANAGFPRSSIASAYLMLPELLRLRGERDRLQERLKTAVQYLREGKIRFTPGTTNSFVDDFIAAYDAEEPGL